MIQPWYVIEKATDRIVTVLESSIEPDLKHHFEHPDLYRCETAPTAEQVAAYGSYWKKPV